mgnify:CR=1 FL=1|jgi:hypothetical protein
MASKKIYASPEIEIIKFSFENILAGETDDPEYIKQSNPDNHASGGASVAGDDFDD